MPPTTDALTYPPPALVSDGTACQPSPAPRTGDERRQLADATLVQLARAHQGDPALAADLRDQVVVAHLWLAASIARRYRGRGEEDEDLLQVARAGLVEASLRHDPASGPYAPFAAATVSGLLKRYFRDHGWRVRPPRATQELAGAMWRQWPDSAQAGAGAPSEKELAARLGASLRAVREASLATQGYRASSLDELAVDDGRFADAAGDHTEAVERRLLLATALAGLTRDEQQLLVWRFWEGRSQSEIGGLLGAQQMQVSRLLARLLTKLRGTIGSLDAA